jgi:hypothetical protein
MAKDKIVKNFWTGDYYTEHYDASGNYAGKSVPKYDAFREKSYIEHYDKDGVVQQHSVLEKGLFSNKPKWNTYDGAFFNAEIGLWIFVFLLLALVTLVYIGLSWGALICMILAYNADKKNKKTTYYIIAGFVILIATTYLSSVDLLKENEYLFKFTGIGLIFGILSTFICLFVILIRAYYKKIYGLFILTIFEFALVCIYAFTSYIIIDYKILPVDLVINSGKDFEVVKNKMAEQTYEAKKESYKVEFEAFRKSKPIFKLNEYRNFESEINGYPLNFKDANFGVNEIENGKDFIIVEFGSIVFENIYALEKSGYNGPHLEKIFEFNAINGFDLNYQFRSKDHIKDIKNEIGYGYYEAAIERGEEIFRRIFVEAMLIQDNIDEYIKYKEAKNDLKSNKIKVYLHDEYLNNKNIPITLDNFFKQN